MDPITIIGALSAGYTLLGALERSPARAQELTTALRRAVLGMVRGETPESRERARVRFEKLLAEVETLATK